MLNKNGKYQKVTKPHTTKKYISSKWLSALMSKLKVLNIQGLHNLHPTNCAKSQNSTLPFPRQATTQQNPQNQITYH